MKAIGVLFALGTALQITGQSSAATPQVAIACPAYAAPDTKCYSVRDDNGSFILTAIPASWNKNLVIFAHGGPRLEAPNAETNIDEVRGVLPIATKLGYAFSAASYRRGGYALQDSAEDTENARKAFVEQFGQPTRTILYGNSYGAQVSQQVMKRFVSSGNGPKTWDGAFITSGALAPIIVQAQRIDLSSVYRYICKNLPRPDEPQYPLSVGLPAGSKFTPKDLDARVNECTGAGLPEASRTDQQKKNFADILRIVRLPPRDFMRHMNFTAFSIQNLVQVQLNGRSPFTNVGVKYVGSDDDEKLNANVERFIPDETAFREFTKTNEFDGKLYIPVVTTHAIADPYALVEHETAFRESVEKAGSSNLLLQYYLDEGRHGMHTEIEIATGIETLGLWLTSGAKPKSESVQTICNELRSKAKGDCKLVPSYVSPPLYSRLYQREFPQR